MIAYSIGVYDVLREEDLRDIDRQIQLSREKGIENFAIGVYSDELSQALGLTKPLKSLEDRLKIMNYIRGIDVVFPVYSLEQKLIKNELQKALEKVEKEKQIKKVNENKKYKLSYVPGTFDLFHAGHLEHLLIANNDSEELIVGIKADELVQKQKNKLPVLSQEERAEILRHFKFVNDVYIFYTRDLKIINDYVKTKYKKSIDAAFFGSDVKNNSKEIEGINVVYTERDEKLMQQRSTTAYSKRFKSLKLGTSMYPKLTGKINVKDTIKGVNDQELEIN